MITRRGRVQGVEVVTPVGRNFGHAEERATFNRPATRRLPVGFSVRQIDRLIAQGDLATREVGRKQLLIYDSLKQFCNGGGRPKAVHANA